jgi:hypothetical protein
MPVRNVSGSPAPRILMASRHPREACITNAICDAERIMRRIDQGWCAEVS